MSGRGRRGHPRRVIPAVHERRVVPMRDEHVVGSITASMNQPPAVGEGWTIWATRRSSSARIIYGRASGTNCTDSSHIDPSVVAAFTAT